MKGYIYCFVNNSIKYYLQNVSLIKQSLFIIYFISLFLRMIVMKIYLIAIINIMIKRFIVIHMNKF
jgi:hypothetical protein